MTEAVKIEAALDRLWGSLSGRNRVALVGLARGRLDGVLDLLQSRIEAPHPFVVMALHCCLDPSCKAPVKFIIATGKRGAPPRWMRRDFDALVADLASPGFDRALTAERLARLPLAPKRPAKGRPAGTRTLGPLSTVLARQWVSELVEAGELVGTAREQVARQMKVGAKLLELRLGENSK
jgi:hypothetical protein